MIQNEPTQIKKVENHIFFLDKNIANEFVRKLLYPAILGSLIYDFTNFKWNNDFILLSITLVFYLIDYFYWSIVDKEIRRKAEIPSRIIWLDLGVAFLFMFIIYSIHACSSHREFYYLISIWTFLIFVAAYFYLPNKTTTLKIIFLGLILASIILFCIQYFNSNCCSCDIKKITNLIYSINIILYAAAIEIDYLTSNKQ